MPECIHTGTGCNLATQLYHGYETQTHYATSGEHAYIFGVEGFTSGPRVQMQWTWRQRTQCMAMAALSVFCGVPSVGMAQAGASLSGRVVDEATGAPVADVEVWIDGVGTRVTEADGSFSFASVPQGDWVLTVRHVAFGAHWQEVEAGEEPQSDDPATNGISRRRWWSKPAEGPGAPGAAASNRGLNARNRRYEEDFR